MDLNEYQQLAAKTKKTWDNKKMELSYYGLGLTGEAGEVAEIIKKDLCGSKQADMEDLKKELGDVLWYISAISGFHGFTLEEVANRNIEKLKARHGDSWSGYGDRSGAGA